MRIGIHSPIFLSLYPFGFHSTTEFKIHRSSRKSLQFTVQWVFLIVPFTDFHCTSLYISTDKQITSLNAPVQCTDKHFKQLYPAVLLIRKKIFPNIFNMIFSTQFIFYYDICRIHIEKNSTGCSNLFDMFHVIFFLFDIEFLRSQ